MPPVNDIRPLRENVYNFILKEIIPKSKGTVLEIGPSRFPTTPFNNQLFVDIEKELKNKGLEYISVDNNPNINPDIVSDILDLKKEFHGRCDTIIALEVLEHVSEFWKVPKIFYDILRTNGQIFVSTPFYFLWHDPKPDYWRMSRDGLQFLFGSLFNVKITPLVRPRDDGKAPIHHTLVGIKK